MPQQDSLERGLSPRASQQLDQVRAGREECAKELLAKTSSGTVANRLKKIANPNELTLPPRQVV